MPMRNTLANGIKKSSPMAANGSGETQPLSKAHPLFVACQRDVALAIKDGDTSKLRVLQQFGLNFGFLVRDGEIEKSDAMDGLLEIADAHDLCDTPRKRADIEHVL